MITDLNLGYLFDHYGTDKARNGYHITYEDLLRDRRHQITAVLEIGVGTLNPDALSSMAGYAAPHYQPGGSLRAWRDYFPDAIIWGIDTQPDTMIDDGHIVTFIADSTNLQQLDRILSGQTFDLIIDDGDHDPRSQLLTFTNLWHRVKPGGHYVIEDILGPPPNIKVITCPT